jgi:hypothetical protein
VGKHKHICSQKHRTSKLHPLGNDSVNKSGIAEENCLIAEEVHSFIIKEEPEDV